MGSAREVSLLGLRIPGRTCALGSQRGESGHEGLAGEGGNHLAVCMQCERTLLAHSFKKRLQLKWQRYCWRVPLLDRV